MTLFRYTPALTDPHILKASFIGHSEELKSISRILNNASSGNSFSHAILIGPKGIGKSHILRLIYYCIKNQISIKEFDNFKEIYIPVITAEEEYINSIEKFILLIFKYLIEGGDINEASFPQSLFSNPPLNNIERHQALSLLKDFKQRSGKILLLLIDNIDKIILSLSEEDQSAFREILMTSNSVLVIGTSPTLFDSILNHDQSLYNFFEIIWLNDLSFEETKELLKAYSDMDKNSYIKQCIGQSENKLCAIYALTGGNPRLILTFYQLIKEENECSANSINSIETLFLQMLDELSPYFRERMNDIAPQQRIIMDELAIARFRLTPTELAIECHLPVNVVNSQLHRLEKIGYVFKVKLSHSKIAYYEIKEKLFSLWRQMRVEAGRKRITFIIRIYEIWYSPEELLALRQKHIDEIKKGMKEGCNIEKYLDKIWYITKALHVPELDYQTEAVVEYFKGNHQAAINLFKEHLLNDPSDRQAYIDLASILSNKQLYYDAIEYYRKADEIATLDNSLRLQFADAYFWTQKYEEAIIEYRKALSNTDEDFELWTRIGTAYMQMNNFEDAAHSFRKALENKPQSHVARTMLGESYLRMKMPEIALESFKEAIDINPNYLYAWHRVAFIYYNRNQFDEAINAYKKIIELEPNNIIGWSGLSNIYLETGRYDESIKANQEAIRINQTDYKLYSFSGAAYFQLQKYEEAIQEFQKSLKINPEYVLARTGIAISFFSLAAEHALDNKRIDALNCLSHFFITIKDLLEFQTIFPKIAATFKNLIKARNIEAIEFFLETIEKADIKSMDDLLGPLRYFIKYIKKRDDKEIIALKQADRAIINSMIDLYDEKINWF